MNKKMMICDRKMFFKFVPIVALILILIVAFVYKIRTTRNKEEIVVSAGSNYQKVAIPSGDVLPANAVEKGDLSGFSGLPDKNDKQFYKNYSLIYSEDKNKVAAISFLGQEENASKQKEFICNLPKKQCAQAKFFFNTYKVGELDIMSHSIWWLGWNARKNLAIGLTVNEVNNGTLYVCNVSGGICNKSPKDKLNFPQGAINKSLNKIVAIRQHDIINEKTGDKWELLLYDVKNLNEPLKTYDISSAIDRDGDIAYDGVNSIVWSKNDRTILIGTARNIFKFDLKNGKLDKIFTDVSTEEDDFYWNSDKIRFSPSERYAIFVDTVSEDSSLEKSINDEDASFEEGVLKAIDLKDGNKVKEIFRAKDLVLK